MWELWEEGPHRHKLPRCIKKLSSSRALDEWIPELTGTPIRPRQRPLSPTEQALLRTQVETWLGSGVIEPRPHQPLNNNLVFVAKSNGRIRVCDDCSPVNAVTRDYDWPLPRLQDIRMKVTGSRYFTRLDLTDAFFRIKIPAQFRYLTAFTSGTQQYQFRRMPFGLKTAPAVFQQFMDTTLAPHTNGSLWYIDDILIHAESLHELRTRTAGVKRTLRLAGCKINEDKSEYERTGLLFAGLYVHSVGVGPNLKKVREVLAIPPPTTKKDVQSALGLVSYLRDFIPLVSHFSAHLYPGKDDTTLLSPAQYEEEWTRLLRHVTSAASSMRHWDERSDASLFTDASGHSLGVVIIQHGKVVAVSSRKLTPAETRYSATDREHLGLVHAAKRFRVFLHRQEGETQVWSDHAALVTRKGGDMTPRQARWHELVTQWIPNAKHVKGLENPADIFSRWPVEIFGGVLKL